MRPRDPGLGIVLWVVLFLSGAALASAKEKAVAENKPAITPSNELEEGSKASEDDGMGKSRFEEEGDDTYTDDSASLDDLTRSKFPEGKEEDDRGTDEDDR